MSNKKFRVDYILDVRYECSAYIEASSAEEAQALIKADPYEYQSQTTRWSASGNVHEVTMVREERVRTEVSDNGQ